MFSSTISKTKILRMLILGVVLMAILALGASSALAAEEYQFTAKWPAIAKLSLSNPQNVTGLPPKIPPRKHNLAAR